MKTKSSDGKGNSYSAVVTKVKDDRVFFEMEYFRFTKSGIENSKKTAAFFVKQKNFNPHTCFKCGEIVEVKVIKVFKPSENFYHLNYEVIPCSLPIDEFIKAHPIGTMVQGSIEAITGATMVICLAPNVYALTKRCKHAHTGQKVDCKIDKYRNQEISLRVF